MKKIFIYIVLFLSVSLLAYSDVEAGYIYDSKWGSSGTGNGQFNFPNGVAIDSSGNIYVVDTNNHRIQKFDSSGVYITKWGSSGSANGQFSAPIGIAIDSLGNIYVADTNNNRIQKFSSTTAYVTKWGTAGSGNGQFTSPEGVMVDASDNVYVADAENFRVQKFTSSGVYTTKWGSAGTSNGQFDTPVGLARDSSGNVYVTEEGDRVQKFNSTGTFISSFGSAGTGDGQFNNPRGITFDSYGNIYVADRVNHRVQKFNSSGNFVSKLGFGILGSADGQFDTPSGVAISTTSQYMYISDRNNYRIQRFIYVPYPISTTSAASSLTQDTATLNANLLDLGTTTVTQHGFVYGTSSDLSITIATTTIGAISTTTTFLSNLTGLTADTTYYFKSYATNSEGTGYGNIASFTTLPLAVPTITTGTASTSSPHKSTLYGTISSLGGLPATSRGFYWGETDSYGATTEELGDFAAGSFSANLSSLTPGTTYHYMAYSINSLGTGSGDDAQFTTPEDFTSVQSGNWNDGSTWGNDSPGVAGIDYPNSSFDVNIFHTVTLNSDSSAKDVLIKSGGTVALGAYTLSVAGNFKNYGSLDANTGTVTLTGSGQRITGVNTFYNLVKNVSAADTLYLASTTTVINNLNLSGVSGGLLTVNYSTDNNPNFSQSFGENGTGNGQFDGAQGVGYDASGNIYVVDTANNRVQKFDSSGNYLSQFGSFGTAENQFDTPIGIAIDSSGNIYIADNRNERIQKFDSSHNFIKMWGWGVATGGDEFETCTSSCQIGISDDSRDVDGMMWGPAVIKIGPNGNLYVTQNAESTDPFDSIIEFDTNGNFVSRWGAEGTEDGQFYYGAYGIDFDSEGNIYVADISGVRIQKFDSDKNFMRTWGWGVRTGTNQSEVCLSNCRGGNAGSGEGQLNGPASLVIDTLGNVIVVDYGNNNIQRFDSDGNYLSQFGSFGSLDNEFNQPKGLVFDTVSQNLLVADSAGFKIKKFSIPTTWYVDPQGTETLSYLNVKNSNSVSSVTCISCINGGGNTNWVFAEASGSSSGGGGGGGGGYSGVVTSVAAPQQVVCSPGEIFSSRTGQRCTGTSGSSIGATTPITSTQTLQALGTVFTRNITLGVAGNDVLELQKFLNSQGFPVSTSGAGSPGNESTYFGPATRAALAKWQAQNGVSPAQGYFGPVTRARILEIFSVQPLNTQSNADLNSGSPTMHPSIFVNDLTIGSEGEEVRQLQKILNLKGFPVSTSGAGSPGNESTYFGSATRAALAKYQQANNISPAQGYFGPVTRARINQ